MNCFVYCFVIFCIVLCILCKYHMIYLCDVRLSRLSMKDPVSWDVKVSSLAEVCRGSSMTLEYSIRPDVGEECGSSAFHRVCDEAF